jgi:hypothetical protein
MASSQKYALQISTALTAASTLGVSQNLPAKASKLIGHINVSACNAATTVTGKVQHSPDGTNWYDYITFTDIVGAAGVQAQGPATNDQACFQNVRSTVTLAGATKSATVTVDLWFQNI